MGVMDKPFITSTSNPLIKQARALRQKKARRESGMFLVEGIRHIGEVVEAGWDVESVLYAPDTLTSSFAHKLISRLTHKPQPVSPQVMESLADKDNPQGILAIVHQRQTKISNLQPMGSAVAIVSAQDPGNVGTILRTMDAVGIDTLFLLDGGVELYHPSVVRASMGALFWKTVVPASFDEFLHWTRARKYQLIGASAHAEMQYNLHSPASPWVLVLGSEQRGLTSEQSKALDITVSLPMMGRASSLNLSVAAGVLLYQFTGKK
ncbi:MAG TPA: RNA methyltransferase [Anaerolineae bacterium]|nr:RNA methyltransferase [Anaerolineae bacterium]